MFDDDEITTVFDTGRLARACERERHRLEREGRTSRASDDSDERNDRENKGENG